MSDDKGMDETIGMALDEAARQSGDRVATVFANGAVTYAELEQTSDLIMEPCGSSISDIQGLGQEAHSMSATPMPDLKRQSNGIL